MAPYHPSLAFTSLPSPFLSPSLSRSHFLSTCPNNTHPPFSTTSHPPLKTLPLKMSTPPPELPTLNLPPRLQKTVLSFRNVPDPRLRYQQLLFLAKQLPPFPSEYCTPSNKVPGCLSVVYVHAELDKDGKVLLLGDSDALLTKGLIALLIQGFKGCEPEEVLKVGGEFIKVSRLNVSLTPGRNSGFVNMLGMIKGKVRELVKEQEGGGSGSGNGKVEENGNGVYAERTDSGLEENQVQNGKKVEEEEEEEEEEEDGNHGPVYRSLKGKLQMLKPVELEIVDESSQHAGHVGARGFNGESHFYVRIVAEAFDGLMLVKRHKLIYTLLDEEFREKRIHALRIDAKTPAEVGIRR